MSKQPLQSKRTGQFEYRAISSKSTSKRKKQKKQQEQKQTTAQFRQQNST